MSNKGALAVTNLLDSVKGINKLITNKKVIEENENGYGGLQFDLKTKGKSYRHKIFLNFNDLYDLTIRGKTNKNILEEYKKFYDWKNTNKALLKKEMEKEKKEEYIIVAL